MIRFDLVFPLAMAAQVAAQDIPPPRGPNEAVLGTAEETRIDGPARICFQQTGFDIGSGERAYLAYLGFHWAAIRVVGANGQYLINEGNAWADPAQPGEPVDDRLGRRITLHREQGQFRYFVYGRPQWSPDRERPIVRVEGDVLTGGAADHWILDRIVNAPARGSCRQTYVYGFHFEESAQ